MADFPIMPSAQTGRLNLEDCKQYVNRLINELKVSYGDTNRVTRTWTKIAIALVAQGLVLLAIFIALSLFAAIEELMLSGRTPSPSIAYLLFIANSPNVLLITVVGVFLVLMGFIVYKNNQLTSIDIDSYYINSIADAKKVLYSIERASASDPDDHLHEMIFRRLLDLSL